MTNENQRFRRLTRAELNEQGLSNLQVGSRYLDARTGDIVTRRGREDVRAREIGFKNYSQFQRLESNRMYNVFRRIRSTLRGGIPTEQLRSLTSPESVRFNRGVARMISSGEMSTSNRHGKGVARPQPGRQARRFFREELELTPSMEATLFQTLGNYPIEAGQRKIA